MTKYPRLLKGGKGRVFRKTCMMCKEKFKLRTPRIQHNCLSRDDTVLNVCQQCLGYFTLDDALKPEQGM